MRRSRILTLAVATLSALAVAAPASAATCSIAGQERKLGATYVTKLTQTGTSCSRAREVTRAFHRCRKANGGADGRCTKAVLGYRCTDKRTAEVPTQYDAVVSCTNGGKRIRHTYTMFT